MDAVQVSDADAAEEAFEEFSKLGKQAGSMLNQHPYMNLRTWCEHARSQGSTKEIKDYYEEDAPILGNWSPANVSEEWKQIEWTLTQEQLASLSGVRFKFTKGSHRLEIRKVQVEADGSIVAEKSQLGKASNQPENTVFTLDISKEARGNNSCSVRAEVRAVGGTKSYGNVEMILSKEKKAAK